jgi:hypothetical protein
MRLALNCLDPMRLVFLSIVTSLVVACAGPAPQIKVLGVSETGSRPAPTRELVVFVEVVNPTAHHLRLSRLEYRLKAHQWIDSDGHVPITREVAADSSMVVEIPVPVRDQGRAADAEVPYTLQGRLFVVDKQMERSWPVEVQGTLKRDPDGSTHRVRLQVADAQ